MAKKKNNRMLIWAVMIIGVLILSKADWSKPTAKDFISGSQFAEKETSDTVFAGNFAITGTASEQNVEKVNLCSSISPYITIFNLEELCKSNGGSWVCNENEIGCYVLSSPMLDCNLAVIKTAISKCQAVNAGGYCNTQSVYCSY